jgi:membrane-associated protein
MRYTTFALFNVLGGILWVGICLGAGYVFGNVPVVKNNFSLVAIGIVAVSMIPMLVEWLRHRKGGS